jgi:hypothetical protein
MIKEYDIIEITRTMEFISACIIIDSGTKGIVARIYNSKNGNRYKVIFPFDNNTLVTIDYYCENELIISTNSKFNNMSLNKSKKVKQYAAKV